MNFASEQEQFLLQTKTFPKQLRTDDGHLQPPLSGTEDYNKKPPTQDAACFQRRGPNTDTRANNFNTQKEEHIDSQHQLLQKREINIENQKSIKNSH